MGTLSLSGHAVAQLVEALRYKPEGRGFASRWCHWNFSLTLPFRPHCSPGVDSASNRNEYQEYFLGVKMAVAKGWQPYLLHVPIVLKSGSLNLLEPPGPVQACNRIALPCLFPGDQSAGVWCWPHAPSSAEVKERVELYLYSSSGSSWPFYHRGESLNNLVF